MPISPTTPAAGCMPSSRARQKCWSSQSLLLLNLCLRPSALPALRTKGGMHASSASLSISRYGTPPLPCLAAGAVRVRRFNRLRSTARQGADESRHGASGGNRSSVHTLHSFDSHSRARNFRSNIAWVPVQGASPRPHNTAGFFPMRRPVTAVGSTTASPLYLRSGSNLRS
jgi:hypothetical protein